jgi:hypothetical protein
MRRCSTMLLLAAGALAQSKPALDPALLPLAAAYAAKVTASAVFVSGRTVESVLAEELAPDAPLEAGIRLLLKLEVDEDERTVRARIGKAEAVVVTTRNLGCTLAVAPEQAAVLAERGVPELAGLRAPDEGVDFPAGERIPPLPDQPGIDVEAVRRAVRDAFLEPKRRATRRTRAVVVVHAGRLIEERYADGYDAAMPLPGWSMSKTIAGLLVGLRAHEGKLDLQQAPGTVDWPTGDERRAIRLHHLLSMTSGLAWNESYSDPESTALRMLFGSADSGAAAAAAAKQSAPGTEFRYSSGSTNLLCREFRATFADARESWSYARDRLFAPLGMRRAVLETDAAGNLVGSSFGFATARDWARLGMLFVGDNAGGRVVPPEVIAAMCAPAPGTDGRYGRQLWLNVDPDGEGPRSRPWPGLPTDAVALLGFQGQYVYALPSLRVVVVRLGCTKSGEDGALALAAAVAAAVSAPNGVSGR